MTTAIERQEAAVGRASEMRELAFHELETSHATLRKITGLMNRSDPLVRHMSQVLGVAENSLRILEANPAGEIKALTGPVHDEASEARETEAREVATDGTPKNGTTDENPFKAHAATLYHCGGKKYGCNFSTHGNSYGRHQSLCEYFQIPKLLAAGHAIPTFKGYYAALRRESRKGNVGSSAGTLKAAIERDHGSYSELLAKMKKLIHDNKKSDKAA